LADSKLFIEFALSMDRADEQLAQALRALDGIGEVMGYRPPPPPPRFSLQGRRILQAATGDPLPEPTLPDPGTSQGETLFQRFVQSFRIGQRRSARQAVPDSPRVPPPPRMIGELSVEGGRRRVRFTIEDLRRVENIDALCRLLFETHGFDPQLPWFVCKTFLGGVGYTSRIPSLPSHRPKRLRRNH
jgi:hypothetical protein